MKGRVMTVAALSFIIGLALIFALVSSAGAETGEISWYCVRAKEHKQPKCDDNMAFIEKYGGYYIDHLHDDSNSEKKVYLTFDVGYENGNVAKILDILSEQKVCGAFFILGNMIEREGELVKRMANEGHIVCNHTYSHKNMTRSNEADFLAELQKLETAYRELTGEEMSKYYRPPEGRFNENTMKYANEAGYKTIFWSFAYADWDNARQMSVEAAKKKILDNIHNGGVLLFHPTSATNAAVLGDIITELKNQGYTFGSLDELTK